MRILDKLTGKKEGKVKSKKDENVLDMVKDADHADRTPTVLKEDTGRAHHILKQAHLSEKTNLFSGMGRYVFRVSRTANKIEVKKAVEATYDVKVIAVNIINTKGKLRRMGRTYGRTSDWKKAIVTLKSGQKISGLGESI